MSRLPQIISRNILPAIEREPSGCGYAVIRNGHLANNLRHLASDYRTGRRHPLFSENGFWAWRTGTLQYRIWVEGTRIVCHETPEDQLRDECRDVPEAVA